MTRSLVLFRHVLVSGLILSLSGCSFFPFSAAISEAPKTIVLDREAVAIRIGSPDPSRGVTVEDTKRIHNLVARYRDEGEGSFIISAPSIREGESASNAVLRHVYKAVTDAGIPADRIDARSYWAPDLSNFRMGYYKVKLSVPNCQYSLASIDVSSTRRNRRLPNFGCVTASNIAAMIADPAHIAAPAASAPSDPVRIADIVDKYQKGDSSSSAPQQTVSVSGGEN